jgi:hypothetical protein
VRNNRFGLGGLPEGSVKGIVTPKPYVPEIPRVSDSSLNPAKWMYERLAKRIIDFEKELASDEEIGGRFVAAPNEGVFHIEDISYWGPDMIMFEGVNQHGKKVELLQHYSQMTVLLTAIPKIADEPRRIGFQLAKDLQTSKEV